MFRNKSFFTEVCPLECNRNESTVCVQHRCICALGLQDDGVCKTGKLNTNN